MILAYAWIHTHGFMDASDMHLPQQAFCGGGRQPWTPVQMEHTRVLSDLLSCTRRGHFLLHRADAESFKSLAKHYSNHHWSKICQLKGYKYFQLHMPA